MVIGKAIAVLVLFLDLALLLPVKAEPDPATALQASFIWSPSAPAGQQAYVAFRKTFTLV